MIAGLKPYNVYKNSGVPWLGEVPEHWKNFTRESMLFNQKRSQFVLTRKDSSFIELRQN